MVCSGSILPPYSPEELEKAMKAMLGEKEPVNSSPEELVQMLSKVIATSSTTDDGKPNRQEMQTIAEHIRRLPFEAILAACRLAIASGLYKEFKIIHDATVRFWDFRAESFAYFSWKSPGVDCAKILQLSEDDWSEITWEMAEAVNHVCGAMQTNRKRRWHHLAVYLYSWTHMQNSDLFNARLRNLYRWAPQSVHVMINIFYGSQPFQLDYLQTDHNSDVVFGYLRTFRDMELVFGGGYDHFDKQATTQLVCICDANTAALDLEILVQIPYLDSGYRALVQQWIQSSEITAVQYFSAGRYVEAYSIATREEILSFISQGEPDDHVEVKDPELRMWLIPQVLEEKYAIYRLHRFSMEEYVLLNRCLIGVSPIPFWYRAIQQQARRSSPLVTLARWYRRSRFHSNWSQQASKVDQLSYLELCDILVRFSESTKEPSTTLQSVWYLWFVFSCQNCHPAAELMARVYDINPVLDMLCQTAHASEIERLEQLRMPANTDYEANLRAILAEKGLVAVCKVLANTHEY
jgi:hypothetical protein